MAGKKAIVSVKQIESLILILRDQRVMIDADLAELYGVPTKALNQAVKRNRNRFPEDFMFQLSEDEKQQVVTDCDHLSRLKFSAVLPHAFTEHGAIMAANILNSERAVDVSVHVVRAFVKVRQVLTTHKQMARKLTDLERKLDTHDETIKGIITALRQLMGSSSKGNEKKIGFKREKGKK